MIKETPSEGFILDIVEPLISFPSVRLEKGQAVGIYTSEPKLMTKYFFKLICEPEKYAKKVTINGLIANGTNWIGRSFTHMVVPEIWNDTICNILKKKPKRRHLIFIGAAKDEIVSEELDNVAFFVEDYKKEGSVFVITDSKELLEKTVDKVLNEKGIEIDLNKSELYKVISEKESVSEFSNINHNVKNLNLGNNFINLE
ncbi:MAG TPA: hypothetical protein PK894_03070 [Defluviitoga sp.]|nr:hypothetical protein [Defluviitoga sp.]HOP24367.1 hypothetical protein [Defluviitoga sp.]HPZ28643.1 hypothetical protein [Defluviitoga sp.]HQD62566.1 hypothetical protein [Defluviitoga sp.]